MRRIIFIYFIAGLNFLLFIIFIASNYFSSILMIIHILSVIILWLWVVYPKNIIKFYKENRRDMAWMVVLILAAFLIRYFKLAEIPPGMWGDEVSVARQSMELLKRKGILPYSDTYFHPTLLMYFTGWSISLFGRSIEAIRLTSVVFGAFGVGAFYVLLRLFFKRLYAVVGAILLCFLYADISISRMAYEQTASIFFEIVSLIFLYKVYKKTEIKYLVGLGLSIGGGLYTYFNFRMYALFIVVWAVFLLLRKIKGKSAYSKILILFLSIFISVAPQLSYGILHPEQYWSRTGQLFIFGQNLQPGELSKELGANILRSLGGFGIIGDPNPRHNPSGVALFDPMTSIFVLIGGLFLYRKNKLYAFTLIVLGLPFFLSDILTLERIPEFHYYGLGHPHTLRISGIIPIAMLLSIYGIKQSEEWLERKNKYMTHIFFAFILIAIISINYFEYFNQKSNNFQYYLYNYKFNRTELIQIADIINKSNKNKVYLPKEYLIPEHLHFFVNESKNMIPYEATSSGEIMKLSREDSMIIVNVNEKFIPILNETLQEIGKESPAIRAELVKDPLGNTEAVLFMSI